MKFTVDEKLYGFTVERAEYLPEFEGDAYVMRHDKTGARLLYLANEDNDKAFSIGFKTPPANDTGVFHILEHSVLCGSEKYPVKEPFVSLLKSSMQTFLNAMTFPDKTLYPVSSTNQKDLLNLMDIYLDAVLNPNIYTKPEIFQQEGWHFELENPEAELVRNGVVYNEMKGVYSDPDSVMYADLTRALYPDTAYQYESGGDPRCIGNLTYDEFLQEHRNHYRLDNSYLTLYGNLDIDVVLPFLDNHLSSFKGHGEGTPNQLEYQLPVENLNIRREMNTSPENACVGFGTVIGSVANRDRLVATGILLDALMGSNEAPLKKALLEANLGGDCFAWVDESRLQPMLVIELKGAYENTAGTFLQTLQTEAQKIVDEGIDKELLEAAIAHTEFLLRERDYGIPNGVMMAISALSSWIYDDDASLEALQYETLFVALREKLKTNFFEELLEELIITSKHRGLAEIVPVQDQDNFEQKELAAIKASLSTADCVHIMHEAAQLQVAQTAPDDPENLDKLPLLELEDIATAPAEPAMNIIQKDNFTLLDHRVPTHGINYLNFYFDLSSLPFEDIPYASILVDVLGKLDTAQHTAAELDTLVQHYLGKLHFGLRTVTFDSAEETFLPQAYVGVSSLEENFDSAILLPIEVWSETKFDDIQKIKAVLAQRKIILEEHFASSGHTAALERATSYTEKSGVFQQYASGVDFYNFLCDLLDNFDERAEDLVAKLEEVKSCIFTDAVDISFAGNERYIDRIFELGEDFALTKNVEAIQTMEVHSPTVKSEAFIIPSDVNYVVSSYQRARFSEDEWNGSWHVLNRLLSFDYLWNEVRVLGGAYGAGFKSNRTGVMQFYSYRDPNIDNSIKNYDNACRWLSCYDPEEKEMRGYIIASTASYDAPISPAAMMSRQDVRYFKGLPSDIREITRKEILSTTGETISSLARDFYKLSQNRALCVFGNEDAIKASEQDWNIKKLY